jgi:hypothetical protein
MTRKTHALFGLGLLVLLLVSAWLRTPGFTQGGFANHDVGGIMYNGMLLAAGKLPYVHSIEFKAPGTFYLASLLAEGGRDIAQFQVWANLVALGSLATVAIGTRALWGARAGLVAGSVYGLHDLVLDTMDANYITWAQLPATAAVVVAMTSLRGGSRPYLRLGLAGALACIAIICKRPAGIALLAVLVVVAINVARTQSDQRGREAMRQGGVVLLGVGLAALPISVHYLAHGELSSLWTGFVRNEWGWRYVAQGSAIGASDAPREAVMSASYFLALPVALSAFALGGLFSEQRRVETLALLAWSLLALGAAAVGFRFYKGYYLLAAAPLSILAASPRGLLGNEALRSWPTRVVALLPALLLVARQGVLIEAERVNRMRPHDLGGRAIAKRVEQATDPGDTLWVWGWHLWDVYAFTGRLSSTRFYKTMELTTSANDATWRHPRSRLRFRDDLAARELIAELRETPPDYIVLGSAVPVREFDELRALLRERYVRDRAVRLNRVQFWKLRPQ